MYTLYDALVITNIHHIGDQPRSGLMTEKAQAFNVIFNQCLYSKQQQKAQSSVGAYYLENNNLNNKFRGILLKTDVIVRINYTF